MSRKVFRKSKRVSRQRAKNKSWKGLRLLAKAVRVVKVAVLAIMLTLLLLGATTVFSFYKFFKVPFASSLDAPSVALSLDKPFTIAVIILEDRFDKASKVAQLYYIVVDPKETEIEVFDVPVSLQLSFPGSIGNLEVSKAFAYGELSGERGGRKMVESALEKIFAKKADRYIFSDLNGLKRESRLQSLGDFKNLSSFVSIRNVPEIIQGVSMFRENFESNLLPKELLWLLGFSRKLTPSSFMQNPLVSEDLMHPYELDKKISQRFADEKILAEQKRIVILNGADVTGLGSFVARQVNNIGVLVSEVNNAAKVYEKSIIIYDDVESKTVKEIMYQTGITNIALRESVGSEYLGEGGGADITIIVGIDYYNSL